MGTEYVRNSELPAVIEVNYGEVKTISVDHIFSKHFIGNSLSIKLRQKVNSVLAWVTLIQGNDATQVQFAPEERAAGDYSLFLESYDDNGDGYTILKQD